jgi:hypothetical protein
MIRYILESDIELHIGLDIYENYVPKGPGVAQSVVANVVEHLASYVPTSA